jgi:hypothetical protein
MKIEGYFSGWTQFEIVAENKNDAMTKAKAYCQKNFGPGGNYKLNTIECIKKMKGK